jgi:hypothetical protein
MKGSRLVTLSLLMLSLLCFFAAPAFADGSQAAGQSSQQGATNLIAAVEDPGGSNSKGIPSHDDDWGRKDKPNNGAWGSGRHPSGPFKGDISAGVVMVLNIVASL